MILHIFLLWDLNRLEYFETGQTPFLQSTGTAGYMTKSKGKSNRLHQQNKSNPFVPGNQGQSRQLTAQGKAHQAPVQGISEVAGIAHHWHWQSHTHINSAVTSVKLLVWARAGVWEQGCTIRPCIKHTNILHLSSISYFKFSNSGTCNAPVIISYVAPGNKITADASSFIVRSLLLNCESASLEGYII